MPEHVAHAAHADGDSTQAAVLTHLLRADHSGPWMRAEIEREMSDIGAWTVNDALACLAERGLVVLSGEQVLASDAARKLRKAG
jgi:hypothetical protein